MLDYDTSEEGDDELDSFYGEMDSGHHRQSRLKESLMHTINDCISRDNLSVYDICGVLDGIKFAVTMSTYLAEQDGGQDSFE